MSFIPVPNTALARIVGTVDGQLTINTLYFEISGGGISAVNIQDLAVAVDGWAATQLAPLLSEDWVYVRTETVDLTALNSFQGVAANGTPGGQEGEAVPNNVAACVSFNTGVAGRSFRGRNYVPGTPNSVVVLNTIDGAFRANVLVAYAQLIGAGTFLAGWQWVVASRFTANAPRVSGVTTPVLSTAFRSPYVKSMRSRLVGHGA